MLSVFVYEPEEKNFKTLSENIKQNHLDQRIHAINAGVGGVAGKRKLYLSESPYHTIFQNVEGQASVEISCVTLRDVFESNRIDQIDLLKLDCEGAEFEILQNASDDYLRRIQEIKMEYHNRGDNDINKLKEFLEQKGFRTVLLDREMEDSGIAWFRRGPSVGTSTT